MLEILLITEKQDGQTIFSDAAGCGGCGGCGGGESVIQVMIADWRQRWLEQPVAVRESEEGFLGGPEGTAIGNGVDDHASVAVLGAQRRHRFVFLDEHINNMNNISCHLG